jgi:demethylmenaquinone methyltransferase/2-methoxy-6-polyprenyl-1,4-benzoquinol methylase
MTDDKNISRAKASLPQIRQAYDTLSRFYKLAEVSERSLRRRGLELLSAKSGEKVLEIGFATGSALVEIAAAIGEKGRACGIEIAPRMIELTKERLQKAGLEKRVSLCQGDARRLPYSDRQFNAIYISGTLELFDTSDIPVVLTEIKRVLKKGGRLVVSSLSRNGKEGALFVRIYEWLHRRFPKYINCRTIYPANAVLKACFSVLETEPFKVAGVASYEIVLATK